MTRQDSIAHYARGIIDKYALFAKGSQSYKRTLAYNSQILRYVLRFADIRREANVCYTQFVSINTRYSTVGI